MIDSNPATQNADLTDVVILYASPPFSDLVGFDIGGYRLVNVRMFWIEGELGITDFLRRQDLPTLLPRFEGRIAFDFDLITDPSVREFVFFDGFVKLRQNQAHLRDGITLSRASLST